jgi:signal transduction histidine kinase
MTYENNKIQQYVIPLTALLVMAIFVLLLLIMGIMDLKRLDGALIGFMENRGLDIVATIENVAQEDLNFLRRALREKQEGRRLTPIPLTDKEHSIQEFLVKSLAEVARGIDLKWQEEHLVEEDLKSIARKENLSFIIVLNEWGEIAFQSKKKYHDPSTGEDIDLTTQKSIMGLFERLGKHGDMGYIALRRKDGGGSIIIALDAGKLKYWSTKIAVEKIINEVGWKEELAYLVLMDRSGRKLGEDGDIPQKVKDANIISQDILAGKIKIYSQKTLFNGKRFLDILAPVRLDNEMVGYARLGLKWDRAEGIIKENRNRMIIFTTSIVLIGILSIWALYLYQRRHLIKMEEMGKRLQRAERLFSMGQLAAGVAHEIRNPLNAISMASQRLQREYSPDDEGKKEEFLKITKIIRDEIRRLNEIIEEFVTFFRIRRLDLKVHSLEEILGKIFSLMVEEASTKGITIKTAWCNNNIMVSMDEDKLKQAFYNILKNAMESISGSGTITVSVHPVDTSSVSVKITDTGSGLTPDQVDHIFDPEYTTKEKGLGLGLTLSHEIIRGHKGEIRVQSEVGSGTTFEIVLPREKAEGEK